jgi:hypothetical protein
MTDHDKKVMSYWMVAGLAAGTLIGLGFVGSPIGGIWGMVAGIICWSIMRRLT